MFFCKHIPIKTFGNTVKLETTHTHTHNICTHIYVYTYFFFFNLVNSVELSELVIFHKIMVTQ